MPIERLQFATLYPEPVEEVFAFFSDIRRLQRLLPRYVTQELLSAPREGIFPGQLLDYRISLLGIAFCWRTRIETVEGCQGFVDSPIRGPYKRFVHTHEFYSTNRGTLMVDRIDYEVSKSLAGLVANELFVRRMLTDIFHTRQRLTSGRPLFPTQ